MLRTVVKALDICMDEDLIVTGMHGCLVNQAIYCAARVNKVQGKLKFI
jgi:hypothetical protein